VSALDALAEIRDAVGPEYPLVMDSGIRRGSDVLKALALGADIVQIGRVYAWGLAVGGQAGAEQAIRNLLAETDVTAALVGVSTVADLGRSSVTHV
jgi:isopentenyl-diphosphate delta-isomerase